MRVTAFTLTFLICTSCLFQGCKETSPEPPKPASISLKAEDASCTEAWLKASTTETSATLRLLRDGQRVSVIGLRSPDSLLIDEGLLPKHTYTYQLQRLNADSSVSETSTTVQLTTMDTTSHNFTWQIDTLGVTSSTLYDVAIINDTLAYAVGEMYLRDSTGQIDPTRYNLAIWNGTRWTIRRLAYYFQGQPFYHPIQAVFALNANDIWFAGNGVSRWDGQRFIEMLIPSSAWGPNRMNKIWGSSGSNIYIVGDNGSIAHYNGSTWRRVESGTTVDIQDAWGGTNRLAGGQCVLLSASNVIAFGEKKLLRVNQGGILDSITWGMPDRRLHSAWFAAQSKVYVCGAGIFAFTGSRWKEFTELPLIFTRRIRGVSENDIFVAGDFGFVSHYNGITWRIYPEADVALWESLDVKGGIVIAVGSRNGTARVVTLRR